MNPHRPRSRAPHEVLVRRPWLAESPTVNRPMIDAVDQLEELAAFFERGYLSRAEFDRQKRKILDL